MSQRRGPNKTKRKQNTIPPAGAPPLSKRRGVWARRTPTTVFYKNATPAGGLPLDKERHPWGAIDGDVERHGGPGSAG